MIAGGLVSLVTMALVGAVVANVIEDGVTRNAAAATALYVDSVIAPILPDMQKSDFLTEPVRHALDETLGQGALGKRLMSFRLWRRDGTVLYSKERRAYWKAFRPEPESPKGFCGDFGREIRSGRRRGERGGARQRPTAARDIRARVAAMVRSGSRSDRVL